MELRKTEATGYTPEIILDATQGKLSITGKSFWENVMTVYSPVLSWLDEYSQTPAKTTVLDIQLEYFNTASAKALMDIFRKLEKLNKNNQSEVSVNWRFNELDEDLQEAGEDYSSMFDMPFNLISFKN
jgi:hypothetical protein